MQLKRFIFGLMAMLAMLAGILQPLSAAKYAEKKNRQEKHRKDLSSSCSSSSHHKHKKCCKKVLSELEQIERTTMQDLVVDQTTLNVVNQINQTTKEDLAIDQEILGIVGQLDCATVIDSLPYVISTPGCYRLCGDLVYDPSSPNTNAINIASDGVVLNLGCYRLSQQLGNVQPTTGIFVTGGKNDITITAENGAISDFQGWGVNFVGPDTGVVLSGVTVERCGSDARTPGTTISIDGGVQIGTFSSIPEGSQLVSEILVENVQILNNKNLGLSIGADHDVIVQDSIIDGTYSTQPIFTVMGLRIQSQRVANPNPQCKDVSLLRTTVSHTFCLNIKSFSPAIPPNGVLGVGIRASNLTVSGCKFCDTVCAADNNNPVGPYISFATNYNQGGILNLLFENNHLADAKGDPWTLLAQNFHTSSNSGSGLTAGLEVTRNHVFQNNTASGAYGYINATNFSLQYDSNLVVENCHAADTQILGPHPVVVTPVSFSQAAIGFWLAPSSGTSRSTSPTGHDDDNVRGALSDAVVKNCTSFSNVAKFGVAYGFAYTAGVFYKFENDGVTPTPPVHLKNISFIDCETSKNIALADGPYSQAAGVGFMIDRGIITTLAQNPPPGPAYKIPESVENIYVDNCRASECYGAQTGLPYSGGIVILAVDKAEVANSSVTDCQNGVLLGGGTSFFNSSFYGPLGNTIHSLVQDNKADNNPIGYNDTAGTNAFVDNVAYNNTIQYNNVANVVANGNRSF